MPSIPIAYTKNASQKYGNSDYQLPRLHTMDLGRRIEIANEIKAQTQRNFNVKLWRNMASKMFINTMWNKLEFLTFFEKWSMPLAFSYDKIYFFLFGIHKAYFICIDELA